jgi:hypothetical protein
MHELGPFIGALRRRLRFLLPRQWLSPRTSAGDGLRARRPSKARMELDPGSPAISWVAWELSRRGRPQESD